VIALALVRTYGDMATTGVVTAGSLTFFSIELPWRDNEAGESCVPEGMYDLIPYFSPKHGSTWCLQNPALGVTADGAGGTRSRCEIHSANWAEQLLGCIALGLDDQPMFDPLTNRVEPAIERSKDAIADLCRLLGVLSTGHTLTITKAA
jgi:hypothetical protein